MAEEPAPALVAATAGRTRRFPFGDWKANAAKHGYQPDSFEWLLYRMGYVTGDESR